jgi:hypothetical protein
MNRNFQGAALTLVLFVISGCESSPSTQASATNRSVKQTASTSDSASNTNEPPAASSTPAVGEAGAVPERSSAADDGEIVDISFEDIRLNMQPDIVFRPLMLTDRAKELEGRRIRISGFMLADAQTRGIKQFVLLKNTECKFGPGGQADHLINVMMNDDQTTFFRREAVHVEGVLKINPYTGPDGNTWSIFDLACDRVENYRPRR